MSLITNAAGHTIDFAAASALMDEGIVASLGYGDGLTEQEFFLDYCAMHLARFGEEFEPNKSNPVW